MGQLTPITGGLCIPTTGELISYFDKNTPIGRENDGTGFLQFLKSQENTSGTKRLSDSIKGVPGKKRGVKLLYTAPVCYSICATPFNCLETRTPYSVPMNVLEYEIDTRYTPCDGSGNPMELSLDSADYAQYCDLDDKSFFDELIIGYDNRFIKEIDRVLVEALLNNITNTVVTYPMMTINQVTGQRVLTDEIPLWLNSLVDSAKMNISDYVLFGGQMIKLIASKFGIKTVTTEGEVYNISGFPPMYYDRHFDSVFGTNAIVLIPKKAFQFVEWTQYEGSKAFKGEKEILFTKNIPLGNGTFQKVDWIWKWDPECSKYVYMPSLYAELVKTIGGNCADTDQDGIFIIKDCNPNVIPVCPTP